MFDWYGMDDAFWQTVRLILGAILSYEFSIFCQAYTQYSTIAGMGCGLAVY